jgi:large subunit ribosomal protein L25
MAEIVLNVEVRERTGTGGAREARRSGKVPGVLYGGARGPVPIAVELNAFRKSLYSGKLLGHLVTLKYGAETQSVIAKDVQFDPVTDTPIHVDLFRVEEHQLIKIAVPVRFLHQDECRGLKRGGTLNIARHEVELWAPADEIPEELVFDLKGLDIGDAVRISGTQLPKGVEPVITDRDFVIATVAGTSAMASADAAVDHAVAEAQAAAAGVGGEVDVAAVEAAARAAVESAASPADVEAAAHAAAEQTAPIAEAEAAAEAETAKAEAADVPAEHGHGEEDKA